MTCLSSVDTLSEMTTLFSHTQYFLSVPLPKKSNAPSPEQVYSIKHSTQRMDFTLNPRLLIGSLKHRLTPGSRSVHFLVRGLETTENLKRKKNNGLSPRESEIKA